MKDTYEQIIFSLIESMVMVAVMAILSGMELVRALTKTVCKIRRKSPAQPAQMEYVKQVRSNMKNTHKQIGFSLIELMVVVAVMAILSGMAFPALGSMSAGNDLNTAQENIIETLKKARGMAVSHSTFATVNINSASHTVQLSLADGSMPIETIQLHQNVGIGADAIIRFGSQGTVTAQTGSTTTTLSSIGYTSLPQRRIDISSTGVVTATR